MDDFALTPAERALFGALRTRGVKFLIIGMGAAVLEGAPVATQDIDLWFESLDTDQITLAAQDAGGFWISGFGMQPDQELVRRGHVLARDEDRFLNAYVEPAHAHLYIDSVSEKRRKGFPVLSLRSAHETHRVNF